MEQFEIAVALGCAASEIDRYGLRADGETWAVLVDGSKFVIGVDGAVTQTRPVGGVAAPAVIDFSDGISEAEAALAGKALAVHADEAVLNTGKKAGRSRKG